MNIQNNFTRGCQYTWCTNRLFDLFNEDVRKLVQFLKEDCEVADSILNQIAVTEKKEVTRRNSITNALEINYDEIPVSIHTYMDELKRYYCKGEPVLGDFGMPIAHKYKDEKGLNELTDRLIKELLKKGFDYYA